MPYRLQFLCCKINIYHNISNPPSTSPSSTPSTSRFPHLVIIHSSFFRFFLLSIFQSYNLSIFPAFHLPILQIFNISISHYFNFPIFPSLNIFFFQFFNISIFHSTSHAVALHITLKRSHSKFCISPLYFFYNPSISFYSVT